MIGAGTVIDKNIPEGTTVYRKSELIKKVIKNNVWNFWSFFK